MNTFFQVGKLVWNFALFDAILEVLAMFRCINELCVLNIENNDSYIFCKSNQILKNGGLPLLHL